MVLFLPIMKRGIKLLLIYVGLFTALLLGYFYFLFRGTDEWKSKLPVISYVKPFSFVNQLGDTITQANTAGKVYVANFFFVTCPGICPHMNNNLNSIYKAFKGNKSVLFLSHTCQPETDSVPALKRYADSMGSLPEQWYFLTGNKLMLYKAARESYHIDDPKNNVGSIEDQFLHAQFLALVDKTGKVRGVYDGLKEKEVNLLKSDISNLVKESNNVGFVNGIFGNAPPR
ncbi:MAG: SCO family protein [Bacteroidetes bacterium]|nr:MAG: SCO family protein [Bacteroidota bacterium]